MEKPNRVVVNAIELGLSNGHIWIDFNSVVAVQWQFISTNKYALKVWLTGKNEPFFYTLTRDCLIEYLDAFGLPSLKDDE